MQVLEPRQLLDAHPIITEFMASNGDGLVDGEANRPDWIEIHNAGDVAINLAGFHLTDNPNSLTKWSFPSVDLDPGQFLVVFASGQETDSFVDASGNLHTNFSLSADGEYLALVAPDGAVLSEFGAGGTDFPP